MPNLFNASFFILVHRAQEKADTQQVFFGIQCDFASLWRSSISVWICQPQDPNLGLSTCLSP